MPEYPEIANFARDMQNELVGRTISAIEVLQPKNLNMPEAQFKASLSSAEFLGVTPRGKWLRIETDRGWLLLNLGMGGEILLTSRQNPPEKHRLVLDLADGAAVAVNFWWVGYAHYVADLAEHAMTARLGPNAPDLSLDEFLELLRGKRGGIKSFLLNQKQIAGIGNVYVQDPLFKSAIHPLRRIDTLTRDEIENLYSAVQETLKESLDLGGAAYELNLYGDHGRWDTSYFLVAYREGKPCPTCATAVEKIKTGSTSTHICPRCQPLHPTA